MSSLQKAVLKSRLPPMGPTSRFAKRMNMKKKDYTPVQWSQYFDKFIDVGVDSGTFRVYLKGEEGPVLLLLHGGGLSALGWSLFAASVTQMVKCRIVALDLRGHGSTKTKDEFNLSAETLSKDIGAVISEMYKNEPPPIILMGHSMGGAIAIHTAYNNYIPSLIGLVVIDVVEGTAMDALSSMQSFLRGRPKTFPSLENAIEWCVRSGQVRNLDSAKVSMPGQIVNCETGELGIEDISKWESSVSSKPLTSNPDQILEENENEENSASEKFKTPVNMFLKFEKTKAIFNEFTLQEKDSNGNGISEDEGEPAICDMILMKIALHKDITNKNTPTKNKLPVELAKQLNKCKKKIEPEQLSAAQKSQQEKNENVIFNLHKKANKQNKIQSSKKEAPQGKYKWRIDLSKTESHWPGWFKGLSNLFLNCSIPKLLILAGIDTLDRELTVGQMQGKFQMQVLPQCGHAVHEDVPDKVAEVLASFMVRFKFAESTGEFHRPFPGC